MQRQTQIEKNSNWLIAEVGLNYTKIRFPLGGVNRKDIFDGNPRAAIPQVKLIDKLRDKTESSSEIRYAKMRQIIVSLKGGFCGELASLVRLQLLELYPSSCVEMVDFENHQALIIGRKKGNPKDISTWHDPALEPVFLDPWAEDIFYLSQLSEKRKSPAIPFYIFEGSKKTLNTSHHYDGAPTILESSNHHKDQDQVSIKVLVENLRSNNPFNIYEQGVSLFKQKEFNKAIARIEQAIVVFNQTQKDSVHVGTCYSTLASCYREVGDFNKAKECCLLAIAIFKTTPGEESEQMKAIQLKMEKITSQLSTSVAP